MPKKTKAQLDQEIESALTRSTPEQRERYHAGRRWGWPAQLAFKSAMGRPLEGARSAVRSYGIEDEAGSWLIEPSATTKGATRVAAKRLAERRGESVYVIEVGEDRDGGSRIVVDREEIRAPAEPPKSRAQIKRSSKGKSTGKAKKTKPALRVAYRLQLTPGELRTVEFARGRYAWADMLSREALENGLVAFTEPQMWQWTDDVDSDAEGGHSPFPLASPELAEKLQRFYDERV